MDVDVFKQRFLPFHPKLYRIAYALLDNKADAEDILQEPIANYGIKGMSWEISRIRKHFP